MHPMPASFLPFFLLASAADGWLGIWLEDADTAIVSEVVDGSPAHRAGLLVGDELLAVGDVATPTRDGFVRAIQGRKVGERVVIKLRRDGKERTVTVQLAQRPEEAGAPSAAGAAPERPPAPQGETRAPGARGYLGMRVRNTDRGVVVEQAIENGPAAAAGVRAGELVVGVDGRRVEALTDLDAELRDAPAGRKLALALRGESGPRTVTVTLGRHPDARDVAVPTEAAPPGNADDREGVDGAAHRRALEAEIAALRAELAELRREVELLRRARGGRQE
jgi:S1-C subfamily serine protease